MVLERFRSIIPGFASMLNFRRTRDCSQGDNVIIPTPEFAPMFAEDGIPFRAKMIEYIERRICRSARQQAGIASK